MFDCKNDKPKIGDEVLIQGGLDDYFKGECWITRKELICSWLMSLLLITA